MKTFRHVSAETIEEATSILREAGGKARIIAGGTDLLGEMKDGILPDYPEILVDIKNIPGLDQIREKGDSLHVGALARLGDLARDETVQKDYPALAEAARKTASPHIREMGTVAGNICQNNRCWYYWVPDNLFHCLRKGGKACYAAPGDARYHSIFGAARVMETACRRACPNCVDIASYMSKIREGDIGGAAELLLEANPLPAITGRVCPHWCENECARGEFDEPVSIREVERFVGNHVLADPRRFYEAPRGETAKRVAVIGSGPAGLSAGHYLRQLGHAVTVFDRMPEAGGLLAYGIPTYRLPRDILHKQVEALKGTGIELKLGTAIDKDSFEELRRSFDAVFVACGAWRESAIGISGEECLTSGTDFLRGSHLKPEEMAGKTVVVIGGGNTAIDVARSLLRLGAQPVIHYRRTRQEMPALQEEIDKAEEEGVRFEFLTQPVGAAPVGGARESDAPAPEARANGDEAADAGATGGVALTCCRMELGEPDASGRPRPLPVEGSDFVVRCDAVMKAIVERPDYSFLPAEFVDEEGKLRIDETDNSLGEGVFAGGDFVGGPATVAEAVSAGRTAAQAINRYLLGEAARDSGQDAEQNTDQEAGRQVCSFGERFDGSCLQPSARVEVPELSLAERMKGLNIEERGTLDLSAVQLEAGRCFNCGCVAVNSSDLAPALITLGATVRTSQRVIDAEEFFSVGVNTSTVLNDGEMVLELEIPRPRPGTKSTFIKFALRKSIDFPIVNCAAVLGSRDGAVESARICLNSVYGVPLRVTAAEQYMVGKPLDETNAERAADLGTEEALPLLNNRYKIQIARTLVKRAILACGRDRP